MIQIRWERFVALVILVAGAFANAAAWLSYGARVASVTSSGVEDELAQTLSSQLPVERLVHLFGTALVVAAILLWVVGGIRERADHSTELPAAT